MTKYFFFFLVILVGQITWAKWNICTATINSSSEKNVFQSLLPQDKFNFIELTGPGDWLSAACAKKVSCDVLLISGHFAGRFFGENASSLSLNDLETYSCQNTCDGFLKRPKEVFLMGCNTLAGNTPDSRTREEYFAHILEIERDYRDSDLLTEMRYGSLIQSTYYNRFRRVFSGNSNIYGFTSKAPLGDSIKESLANYIKKTGDYDLYLKNLSGQRNLNIEETVKTDFPNFLQTQSIKDLSEIRYKSDLCKIRDEKVWISQRIQEIDTMISQGKLPLIISEVIEFFRIHNYTKFDPRELEAFKKLQTNARGIKDIQKILDLTEAQTVKLNYAGLAYILKWINLETFEKCRTNTFNILFSQSYMNEDTRDFVCRMAKIAPNKIRPTMTDAIKSSKSAQEAFECIH